MNDRWHTAIHEAGHAVIGRVLGMVCGGACVVADGDSAGHSICGDPWEIAGEWDARERYREISLVFRGRILAFMAGAEAEVVIFGECAGDDRYQIEMMANRATVILTVPSGRGASPVCERQRVALSGAIGQQLNV